jgi:hypothetical protein
MTLRDVPRWAYVALALIWTSTLVMDAAALSLDPELAAVDVAWGQFLAKRAMVASFWFGISVAALGWFHDRPVTGANVVRTLGITALLSLLVLAAYTAYLTLALVVVTLGDASFRESFAVVWSGKLVHAYVTAWLVAILANALHEYRRRLAKQRESDTLRLKLAETELSLLRAQLEPHFLFNALNSISSLVRLERNQDATDALSKLGRLLRGMLDVGEHPIVTWDWERSFTELYVALQELRFGARLEVRIHTENVAPSTRFPAFLLQPLIENAVRHGRLRDAEPCTVEVGVERDGERLCVTVTNPLAAGAPSRGSGLGLRNIEARLAALYPDAFALEARPEGNDFVVRVSFPERGGLVDDLLEAAQ